jgi:feruloyl-CoA synthase
VPDLSSCRALVPDAAGPGDAEILADPRVRARFAELLSSFAAAATGSSTRVGRLILLADPPALDRGEITDKGSINQRAVLDHRAELVAAIYDDGSPLVIRPA